MMGGYGHGGWGPGEWVAMGLGMLLIWGLVVVAVIALFRSFQVGRHPAPTTGQAFAPTDSDGTPALRILEERFARGDLTEEEYLQRRQILRDR